MNEQKKYNITILRPAWLRQETVILKHSAARKALRFSMRILTMIIGALFMGAGIYLVGNGGLIFMSVAFPIGIIFVIAGVIECLSCNSYRGDNEERSWILTDAITTFVLGALILLNKLAADSVVSLVLGLWVIITGIRNFVKAWESMDVRNHNFYDHLIIGLLNLVCGLYVFFDSDIFNMSTLTMVGLCMIVQGINILNVGSLIIIQKPEFLKTKQEKLDEATAKAQEAKEAAKEAIKVAKEAKAEVRVIEDMPEELIDITVAPKPGTETEETNEQETETDAEKSRHADAESAAGGKNTPQK